VKITPLAIYQKEFRRKAWNGLDPEDVEEFLYQVAEGVEGLLNENAELSRRLETGNPSAAAGETPLGDVARARSIVAQAEREARAILDRAREEAARLSAIVQRERIRARSQYAPVLEFARQYEALLRQHLSHVEDYLAQPPAESGSRASAPDEDTAAGAT
jgi:DivIVA domain-containing protein